MIQSARKNILAIKRFCEFFNLINFAIAMNRNRVRKTYTSPEVLGEGCRMTVTQFSDIIGNDIKKLA